MTSVSFTHYEFWNSIVLTRYHQILIRKAKEKLDPRFATDEELREFILEFKVLPAFSIYSQPNITVSTDNPIDVGIS
jgi:hypothetical protein